MLIRYSTLLWFQIRTLRGFLTGFGRLNFRQGLGLTVSSGSRETHVAPDTLVRGQDANWHNCRTYLNPTKINLCAVCSSNVRDQLQTPPSSCETFPHQLLATEKFVYVCAAADFATPICTPSRATCNYPSSPLCPATRLSES